MPKKKKEVEVIDMGGAKTVKKKKSFACKNYFCRYFCNLDCAGGCGAVVGKKYLFATDKEINRCINVL